MAGPDPRTVVTGAAGRAAAGSSWFKDLLKPLYNFRKDRDAVAAVKAAEATLTEAKGAERATRSPWWQPWSVKNQNEIAAVKAAEATLTEAKAAEVAARAPWHDSYFARAVRRPIASAAVIGAAVTEPYTGVIGGLIDPDRPPTKAQEVSIQVTKDRVAKLDTAPVVKEGVVGPLRVPTVEEFKALGHPLTAEELIDFNKLGSDAEKAKFRDARVASLSAEDRTANNLALQKLREKELAGKPAVVAAPPTVDPDNLAPVGRGAKLRGTKGPDGYKDLIVETVMPMAKDTVLLDRDNREIGRAVKDGTTEFQINIDAATIPPGRLAVRQPATKSGADAYIMLQPADVDNIRGSKAPRP